MIELHVQVYLIKSPASKKIYNEWLCGGALVSTWFILTSAACVEDVDYMYAVAGYKTYVRDKDIETDPCTKTMKKKVIYICAPVKYEFSYNDLTQWSYIDIALAKVETPYNLTDESFKKLCSYIPTVISISYEERHSSPEVDAMVFGWGHSKIWRMRHDPRNYNQKTLMYASVVIIGKKQCKKEYERHDMDTVIDRYMICSMGRGMLDLDGNVTYGSHHFHPIKQITCTQPPNKNITMEDILNNEDNTPVNVEDKTRRENCVLRTNPDEKIVVNKTYGICQNDHGGPLVTWVGAHEAVIGVASVYKVTSNQTCIGPYLYTSTACASAFLDCILSGKKGGRSICDSAPIKRGYDIYERHITWSHHDGSAEHANSSDAINTGKVKYYEQFGIPAKFWDRVKS